MKGANIAFRIPMNTNLLFRLIKHGQILLNGVERRRLPFDEGSPIFGLEEHLSDSPARIE